MKQKITKKTPISLSLIQLDGLEKKLSQDIQNPNLSQDEKERCKKALLHLHEMRQELLGIDNKPHSWIKKNYTLVLMILHKFYQMCRDLMECQSVDE